MIRCLNDKLLESNFFIENVKYFINMEFYQFIVVEKLLDSTDRDVVS